MNQIQSNAVNIYTEGLEKHVFWGMKKHVQLKIVQHKVSVMLYSVQALKIRASQG